jgi:hypothetical protein
VIEAGPLAEDVDRFVAAVTEELAEVSGRDPAGLEADVVVEASNLVAAVADADGRASDDELRAYAVDVGPLLDPPLVVTVAKLREMGGLRGRARWLDEPSVLFDLLVRADARGGGRTSHRYHDEALRLAHAVAAVDLLPSPGEIDAIERYRTMLLTTMDALGVARPGQAAPERTTAAPPRATAGPAPEPTPEPRTLDELLAALDELVGLAAVKREVHRLTSLLRIQRLRAERGLPTVQTSHHLVFTGNPGTGKTTVARLLSEIYRALGVVSKGHLVETDRSALVAGYIGQTATKTRAVLETALGGTVLIDEAYALARGSEEDFGREAIDTLVKFMEDHRDDLAVVAAGYPAEMEAFIATNPGLESRFTRTIHFDDYTDDELVEIFRRMGDKVNYRPDEAALARVRELIAAQPRDQGFGNARYVRNLFESAVAHQAERLAPGAPPDDATLTTLTAADIHP